MQMSLSLHSKLIQSGLSLCVPPPLLPTPHPPLPSLPDFSSHRMILGRKSGQTCHISQPQKLQPQCEFFFILHPHQQRLAGDKTAGPPGHLSPSRHLALLLLVASYFHMKAEEQLPFSLLNQTESRPPPLSLSLFLPVLFSSKRFHLSLSRVGRSATFFFGSDTSSGSLPLKSTFRSRAAATPRASRSPDL